MGLDIFFSEHKQLESFRKVNFLVSFFEEYGYHTDEQEDFLICQEIIEDLIGRCKKILANHTLADKLLPTCNGFFFGSTDYDQYYYDDVIEVLNFCEETLLPKLKEGSTIYFSVWF